MADGFMAPITSDHSASRYVFLRHMTTCICSRTHTLPRLDVLGVLDRDLLLVRDVEERLLPRDLGLALLLGDSAEDDVHRLERETLGLREEEGEGEGDDVDDGEEEELGGGSAAAA